MFIWYSIKFFDFYKIFISHFFLADDGFIRLCWMAKVFLYSNQLFFQLDCFFFFNRIVFLRVIHGQWQIKKRSSYFLVFLRAQDWLTKLFLINDYYSNYLEQYRQDDHTEIEYEVDLCEQKKSMKRSCGMCFDAYNRFACSFSETMKIMAKVMKILMRIPK